MKFGALVCTGSLVMKSVTKYSASMHVRTWDTNMETHGKEQFDCFTRRKKEQRRKQNKYPKNKRLEHELTVFSTKGNLHCLHSLLVYYQSASAQEWLLRKQYTTLLAQFIFVNSPTSPGFGSTVWSLSQDPQTGFLPVLSSG